MKMLRELLGSGRNRIEDGYDKVSCHQLLLRVTSHNMSEFRPDSWSQHKR